MGLADWDLLSLIPGFAQATSLTANQYPNGKGFDCPNQSLGAEAAMMSDEMLKSVGHALCSKDELVAAALRGTDDVYGNRTWTTGGRKVTRQAVPRLTLRSDTNVGELVQRSFAVASIEPVRVDTARELIDDIHVRTRHSDVIDPCAGVGASSLAGCGGGHPDDRDDHHSGGGDSGHGNSGQVDIGEDDHYGDGHDGGYEDDDNSGHGDGDSDTSHDGSDDYADNGDGHSGSDGGDSSHDGDSDGIETVQDDRSGSSDGEDSHSGSDDGDSSGSGDDGHDDGDREDDDHEGDSSGSDGGDSDSSGSGSGGHG
ncbi:MAG: hypothetical protein ABL973_16690 [Micropepsaceae bacterium]